MAALFPTIARHDPAVLKPAISDLVDISTDHWPSKHTLFWLVTEEPALLRRELANAVWTINNESELSGDTPTALESVGTIAAISPELIPDYNQLFTPACQLDGEPAATVTDTVRTLIPTLRSRGLKIPELSALIEWQTTLLGSEEWQCRQRAAALLGSLPTGKSTMKSVLETLIRQMPDTDGDVRTAVLASIGDIVSKTPSLRAPETSQRVAVFLADPNPDVVVQALRTISCHGDIALDAIGVDPIAVSLGHSETEVRRATIETLLAVGMGAPAYREELLRVTFMVVTRPRGGRSPSRCRGGRCGCPNVALGRASRSRTAF